MKKNLCQASAQDKFNEGVKNVLSNSLLQSVIRFDERLQWDHLQRAVKLTLEVEPILRCYLSTDDLEKIQYVWKYHEEEKNLLWIQKKTTKDREGAEREFLSRGMAHPDQQVELCYIEDEESQESSLVVKLNHGCCDGAGLKQYIELLGQCYGLYLSKQEAQGAENNCDRSIAPYFKQLGVENPRSLFDPTRQRIQVDYGFPHGQPKQDSYQVSRIKLEGEVYEALIAYSKKAGVTVNTCILTAYIKSLCTLIKAQYPLEVGIHTTLDLRKYISHKLSLCNMSSTLSLGMTLNSQEDIEILLLKVNSQIQELKNQAPGLQDAVALEAIGTLPIDQLQGIFYNQRMKELEESNSVPYLSNLGICQDLYFGQLLAKDVVLITPAIYTPGFMLGVSTYRGTLSLVSSYYEPEIKRKDVESLMEGVKAGIKRLLS